MIPDNTAQETAIPTNIFPGNPNKCSAAANNNHGVDSELIISSGQLDKAAAAIVLFAI